MTSRAPHERTTRVTIATTPHLSIAMAMVRRLREEHPEFAPRFEPDVRYRRGDHATGEAFYVAEPQFAVSVATDPTADGVEVFMYMADALRGRVT